MFILRAIGKFFARIGRWIKETAWVQPLLIVGGVFVIIFSITPITKWVQSWFAVGDPAANYFGNATFKMSLDNSAEGKSDADDLINYIENYYHSTPEQKEKYGTKFFLCFVEEGCSACDSTYSGFETLQANWNTGSYKIDDENPFVLHSIFTDTCDADNEDINYFVDYFWGNHDFFEQAASGLSNTPYYKYKGSDYRERLENLGGEATSNTAPIYFLIDFEYENLENPYGVTTILFNYANDSDMAGATSYDKAGYLADCWNYKGVFGEQD